MDQVTTNTEVITQLLYEAASKQKICSIGLTNEPEKRIVHPYGICQTGKNKIMIICWQESGFAGTSKLPGYRNLSLMKCTDVEVLDRHFLVKSDFNPADASYMDWVFHVNK